VLKEPEPWKRAKAEAARGEGKKVGSISDLFIQPRWRRSTLVGVCLGLSGMVGLWGIAFFSPELITTALKTRPLHANEILQPAVLYASLENPTNDAAAHVKGMLPVEVSAEDPSSPEAVKELVDTLNALIDGDSLYNEAAFQSISLRKGTRNLAERVGKTNDRRDTTFLNRQLLEQTFPGTIRELHKTIDQTRSRGTLLQDAGALLGMFTFTFVAAYFSRRTAFLLSFALCLVSVSYVFYALNSETDVYWMLP
jgi:hypothetical protein